MKIFRNEKGLGMLQAAAAIGIAAGIGAFSMNLIQQKSGDGKSADMKADAVKNVTDIGTILKSTDACTNSFAMLDATDTSILPDDSLIIRNMKNQRNEVVVKLNQRVGTYKLEYDSFILKDMPGLEDNVQVTPGNIGTTNLLIRFKGKKGTIFEKKPLTGRIRLSVLTDAAGKIVTCFAMGARDDDFWQLSPSDPSKIHYPAGNVGIGTETPAEKLDVSGWVQGQSDDGAKIALGGSATEYQIRMNQQRPLEIWNDTFSQYADLKVRDVRAEGYVKLSPDNLVCDAAHEGSIRYNGSIKRVELCTSMGWSVMKVSTWCLPTPEYSPNDDNDDVYMAMKQDETARGPYWEKNTPRCPTCGCKSAYINPAGRKHARIDETSSKFKSDDSGKTRWCEMKTDCRDYSLSEQDP